MHVFPALYCSLLAPINVLYNKTVNCYYTKAIMYSNGALLAFEILVSSFEVYILLGCYTIHIPTSELARKSFAAVILTFLVG